GTRSVATTRPFVPLPLESGLRPGLAPLAKRKIGPMAPAVQVEEVNAREASARRIHVSRESQIDQPDRSTVPTMHGGTEAASRDEGSLRCRCGDHDVGFGEDLG